MTVHVEYESDAYAWLYDTCQGVGRFQRKEDGALTYWDTGTACQDIREYFAHVAKLYPLILANVLDRMAKTNEFHPAYAADLADDAEHPWT